MASAEQFDLVILGSASSRFKDPAKLSCCAE